MEKHIVEKLNVELETQMFSGICCCHEVAMVKHDAEKFDVGKLILC
jgi:hypothetical protein